MDIEQIRSETPGIKSTLFLNSAGSSLMPISVINAIENHFTSEIMIGGYAAAALNEILIQNFYKNAAQLIGSRADQIAFCTSATDAFSKALSSIPFKAGDVILTTNNDYVSNQIAFISLHRRFGVNVFRCKDLEAGGLDIDDMRNLIISHKPVLVAVTHIPTSSGLIQDIQAVGEICATINTLYLVDACQTLGQVSINVSDVKCDFLTGTGRKFLRGPRGSGLLFVSDKALNMELHPLFTDQGGADWNEENEYTLLKGAKRFERWEKNYSNLLGLSAAMQYVNETGIEKIEKKNTFLHELLRSGISDTGKYIIRDKGKHLSSIVTFDSSFSTTDVMATNLKQHNVSFSVSGINSARIEFKHRNLEQVIRLSPHYFNTAEEINTVINILDEL